MHRERIIDVREAQWGYQPPDSPFITVGGTRHPLTVRLRPAPCYPHPRKFVGELLAQVEAAFPVNHPPLVYLPHFDDVSGINGVTYEVGNYEAPHDVHGRTDYVAVIVLFGKPIPIHPAMTRYLVAHEYGHVVAEVLARRLYPEHDARAALMNRYLNLRQLPAGPATYGPGTWHRSPEEIFANDFRLLVAKQELEFWPHPDIARPEDVPAVVEWWARETESAQQQAALTQAA